MNGAGIACGSRNVSRTYGDVWRISNTVTPAAITNVWHLWHSVSRFVLRTYLVRSTEGDTVAKLHKSYRLEAEIVERMEAWADEHGMTITQGVETLLTRAMDEDRAATDTDGMRRELNSLRAQADTWHEQKAILGDNLRDLRATVSTLTAQVNEKDKQIERLQDTVEHSQILQAAHVAGAIQQSSTDVPQEDTQPDAQPRGVWAWLARKIQGR